MTDTYTFVVILEDTGDEMSQTFNPKDEKDVEGFERSIKEVLEENHYYTESVTLKKVVTYL